MKDLLRRLAVICCALLLAAALVRAWGDRLSEPTALRRARFVRANHDRLLQLGEAALSYEDGWMPRALLRPEHSGWRLFMWRHGILSAFAHPTGLRSFELPSVQIEGYTRLIYLPDDGYGSADFYDMPLVLKTPDHLRYEGGLAGRSYIDLTRLSDHFWYEEAYLPT